MSSTHLPLILRRLVGRHCQTKLAALRSVLVVGATSVIRHVRKLEGTNIDPWLVGLIERKKPKVVAVALANKSARVAWKLMVTGEPYRKHGILTPSAEAA